MTLNIAAIFEAVATAVPERDAIVRQGDRLTYGDLLDRAMRFANHLLAEGVAVHRERNGLRNWEVGQDRVALYMRNRPEFIEVLLGCYRSRAIPFNVNYRYVGEELLYLFKDAGPRVIVYEGRYAETLATVLPELAGVEALVQVEDSSGAPLLPGAVAYETALAGASAARPDTALTADDVYCMYTGGTTGMPKGVLWRQAETIFANLGGRGRDGAALPDAEAFARRAAQSTPKTILPAPPFMHGAGMQFALAGCLAGDRVVIQDEVSRLDPHDLLSVIERERVQVPLFIGDAFGRPVLDAAREKTYDLSSVQSVFNTGALMSASVKRGLLALMPDARVIDALGSSETGPQGMRVTKDADAEIADRSFAVTKDAAVLTEARDALAAPGRAGLGWLAKTGAVPLGYFGDAEKTQATFPEIDGVRYVASGDRVRLTASGEIEFHGRDSFTINSGGEKIFAEEVELALKRHPDVADVTVTGRPSERWGSEVVALVALAEGAAPDREGLLAEAARHIARYKLPKAFLFVETVERGPSGKTDNRWAQGLAGAAT